jgi:hypothetical protein
MCTIDGTENRRPLYRGRYVGREEESREDRRTGGAEEDRVYERGTGR